MRTLIFLSIIACGCSKKESTEIPPPPGDPVGMSLDWNKLGNMKPPPEFPPDEWTHKELREYLESNGLKYAMLTVNGPNVPAVFLAQPGTPAANDILIAEADYKARKPHVLLVQHQKTSKEARDLAVAQKDQAFPWGRFLFLGNATTLNTVKETLR